MKVKFFATYRQIADCKSLEVEVPVDVLGLLRDLCRRWPEFSDKILTPDGEDLGLDAIVLVNGRHIQHLDGVHTRLTNDDTVTVLPLVAGG
jgi:molybdopterin synthase sulfur carrier subunit